MTTQYFKEYSEEQQAEYQKYAEEHWDSRLVQQSVKRWNGLNTDERKALMVEGERITLAIAQAIPLREDSPEVQALVAEWHAFINRFYDCSLEIFGALGEMYRDHPDFSAFYQKIHPALPIFLSKAIRIYCGNIAEG